MTEYRYCANYTVLYDIVWYGMAWHGMAWYGIVWYDVSATYLLFLPRISSTAPHRRNSVLFVGLGFSWVSFDIHTPLAVLAHYLTATTVYTIFHYIPHFNLYIHPYYCLLLLYSPYCMYIPTKPTTTTQQQQ